MDSLERRFELIFESLCKEDFGSALTLVCPLIDAAGKELYGINRTGERFRKVLEENNEFLHWMMTGGLVVLGKGADLVYSRKGKKDITLTQAVYSLIRNSLLHEGLLSDEIEFVDDTRLGPFRNRILFPKNLDTRVTGVADG